MKVVSLPLCHIVLICEMEIECSYTFYEAIQKSVHLRNRNDNSLKRILKTSKKIIRMNLISTKEESLIKKESDNSI